MIQKMPYLLDCKPNFFLIFHFPKMPLGLESVSFTRDWYCRYRLCTECV